VRRWGFAGFIGDAALILANRLEQEIGDYKKNLNWDSGSMRLCLKKSEDTE
jgi:hypothetical protein